MRTCCYGAGYDIRMLGADVPLGRHRPAAARHAVDVVCFTATMADSAERVDAAIDHLRVRYSSMSAS